MSKFFKGKTAEPKNEAPVAINAQPAAAQPVAAPNPEPRTPNPASALEAIFGGMALASEAGKAVDELDSWCGRPESKKLLTKLGNEVRDQGASAWVPLVNQFPAFIRALKRVKNGK